MKLYTIHVNGIPFCEPVEECRKDYILKRLALFPELKVKTTEEEEAKSA